MVSSSFMRLPTAGETGTQADHAYVQNRRAIVAIDPIRFGARDLQDLGRAIRTAAQSRLMSIVGLVFIRLLACCVGKPLDGH
jgi:hypothetical protein